MRKLYLLCVLATAAIQVVAQCPEPSGSAMLDVNNVRARINIGGSSWWDLHSSASYEVPAGSGKHSFYAGSFWIGGLDTFNVPHVAAVRFRQIGMDFWPGPISPDGTVTSDVCEAHDRIYKLNRWEVEEFIARFNQVGYVIPQDILEWPAEGNPYAVANALAPFRDVNSDGIYNATDGDYPAFAIGVSTDKEYHLLGDQCLWWVENDMGNTHTETGSEPLGVQLKCMAYAYASCDPLNDQTFYRYTVSNRSQIDYHDTYIGLWADTDLGFANDDYVQCEVMRHLGFTYNGFAIDGTGGAQHYGAHPPAAGIGILQGPLAITNDGVDNDRNGQIDEMGEHNMMSGFVYHNNASGVQGDPSTGQDYYNYMRGIWLDGSPMCYGGTGHPNGGCDVGLPTNFMFPGDSDPFGYGTGGTPTPLWTEQTAGNVPLDRRFLISSGPFNFNAHQTERIHYAALWARDTNEIDDSFSSADALFLAKDYCQQKFEGAFDNLDCCPPVATIDLDQTLPNQFFFSSPEEGTTYHWDFGDGTTSTERFPPAHQYADNWTHLVRLIVTNECGSDTTTLLAGTIYFGIQDEFLQSAVSLGPNPSNGEIRLSVLDHSVRIEALEIYDAVGSLIYVREQNFENVIDLHISAGLYVALVRTNKGTLSRKLLAN